MLPNACISDTIQRLFQLPEKLGPLPRWQAIRLDIRQPALHNRPQADRLYRSFQKQMLRFNTSTAAASPTRC